MKAGQSVAQTWSGAGEATPPAPKPRRLPGWVFDSRWVALIDQAVVSGASFLTSVTIARFAGVSELGLYATAISVLVILLAVQESLVLMPYAIQKHKPSGTPAEHAGASLALSGLLSIASIAVVVVVAPVLYAIGEPAAVLFGLAALVPFAMARDFARQYGFAHLRVAQVLIIDSAIALIQLGSLAVLGVTGQLSSVTACIALCVAYGITVGTWLIIARGNFVFRVPSLRSKLARSWALGKWLLTGRVTVQVQCYVTYWMALLLGGASMTGTFAACMSVIAFSNPIVFGLGNLLTPRSVLAWKNGGASALLRQASRDSLFLAGLMGAFCLAILLAGDQIMRLLYRDADFVGHGDILFVLAMANAFLAVGMPATNALMAMERPRAVVAVQAIGAIVTIVLVTVLIVTWGLHGAAYGALAGSLTGTMARWAALLLTVRRHAENPLVGDVLRQHIPHGEGTNTETKRLGEGDYATVYQVKVNTSVAGEAAPSPIVIKLYKPARSGDVQMAQDDADALVKLVAAVDGRQAGGWTIRVPALLGLTQAPLALVMTMASGQDVHSLTTSSDTSSDRLNEAADALAAAMSEVWARGIAHGDLGLRNVLIDLDTRRIALIDPGTSTSCKACGALHPGNNAAARDLAHMICELTTDVSDLVGRHDVRVRRDEFVASVAAAAIMRSAEPSKLIDEIKAGFHVHLAMTLNPSWTARGCWHRFIMRLAQDRGAALLQGLAQMSASGRRVQAPGLTEVGPDTALVRRQDEVCVG